MIPSDEKTLILEKIQITRRLGFDLQQLISSLV